MSVAPSHIRPATRGDLPEVIDLLNACDIAEVGEPDTTADDVESDWGFEIVVGGLAALDQGKT